MSDEYRWENAAYGRKSHRFKRVENTDRHWPRFQSACHRVVDTQKQRDVAGSLNQPLKPRCAFCVKAEQTDPLEGVMALLACLTDEQRCELFSRFCMHCGDIDPSCQCWNDE